MDNVPAEPHPRVYGAEHALARWGDRARRSFAALERCDPPADALVAWLAEAPESFDLAAALASAGEAPGQPLPAPVAEFFASVRPIPDWIERRRVDRARRLFERTGIFGALVLSLRSLMGGYTAPAGNKPLAFSGRLREQAPRRVAETARFVTAVCAPGGMRPGAEGWQITLRVRLMHAQVRRLLRASGRWDAARWAEPINQHDMLATMLLFSEVYVEGLRILGFSISDEEAEDWIHLWSLVAWVMGVEAELLPRSYAEATRQRELIEATQGPPDADSRALAQALLGEPAAVRGEPSLLRRARWLTELRLSMARGMSRMLLGEVVADHLGIEPAPGWSRVLGVVPRLVSLGERVRVGLPFVEEQLRGAGAGYWSWVVELSLGGEAARFARPERLRG